MATLRQDDPLHTQIVSQLFILFGEETAIAADLVRRLVEGFEVSFQAGFPLLLVTWVAVQNAVVAHQPAFHFVEPDLVSVFHRTGLFATPDNVGMFFKQAHDLFLGRHLLAMQDAPSGLGNDLLGAWQEGLQDVFQAFGFRFPMLVQFFLGLASPGNRFFGHFE